MPPNPARRYSLRLVLPDLAALELASPLHLKAGAKTLRDQGVMTVEGRDLRILWAEGVSTASGGAVVVVAALDPDGIGLILYLD